ncbi:hypothetical protein AX16_005735 [Volvariella volvacea WC 439]|nr:hypothetical protein AX16_005735 [Volvariella volvacea WC 439]
MLRRRIWNLSKRSKKTLAIILIITLLALAQVTLSLTVMVKLLLITSNPRASRAIPRRLYVGVLIISVVCDSIITTTMIKLLLRAKGEIRGALRRLVHGLIWRSLETGAAVTIAALVGLSLFVRYPSGNISLIL